MVCQSLKGSSEKPCTSPLLPVCCRLQRETTAPKHTGMNEMCVYHIEDDAWRDSGCSLGLPSSSPSISCRAHQAPTAMLGKHHPPLRKSLVQSARHFLCQKYLEESKRSGEEGSCKAEEAGRHSQPQHGDAQELERHKRVSGLCSPLEPQCWQR